MEKVFYEVLPDWTVSVLIEGEWDFFKSYSTLMTYCEANYDHYELVSITNTTYEERIAMGVIKL